MLFIDKLKEEGLVKPNETVEDIVNKAYNLRLYISDLLDHNVSEEVNQIVEKFLEEDEEHYDGDEAEAWRRLLQKEV